MHLLTLLRKKGADTKAVSPFVSAPSIFLLIEHYASSEILFFCLVLDTLIVKRIARIQTIAISP